MLPDISNFLNYLEDTLKGTNYNIQRLFLSSFDVNMDYKETIFIDIPFINESDRGVFFIVDVSFSSDSIVSDWIFSLDSIKNNVYSKKKVFYPSLYFHRVEINNFSGQRGLRFYLAKFPIDINQALLKFQTIEELDRQFISL